MGSTSGACMGSTNGQASGAGRGSISGQTSGASRSWTNSAAVKNLGEKRTRGNGSSRPPKLPVVGGKGSQPFCFVKKGTTFFFCWKVVDNTIPSFLE